MARFINDLDSDNEHETLRMTRFINLDYDSENDHETFNFKYEFEDCENIDEILFNLQQLVNKFKQLKNDGHNIKYPITNGNCILTKSNRMHQHMR